MRFYEVIFFYFRIIAVIGEKKNITGLKIAAATSKYFLKSHYASRVTTVLMAQHRGAKIFSWAAEQLSDATRCMKTKKFLLIQGQGSPTSTYLLLLGPESACKIYTILLKLSLSAFFHFLWHLYMLTFLSLLQCSHRMWALSSAFPPPWSPFPSLMSSNRITWGILGWLNTLILPLICSFWWHACE